MKDFILNTITNLIDNPVRLDKRHPYLNCKTTEAKNTPDLFYNIIYEANKMNNREFLLKQALIFLEDEALSIEGYLESKQASETLSLNLNKKLETVTHNTVILQEKLSLVSKEFTKHIKARKFLPILPVNYDQHLNNVNGFEHSVYFLGSNFTKLTKSKKPFEKVLFDEQDYIKFQSIISGSYSPLMLIKNISKLLNIDKNKVSLVRFSPQFGAFTFYLNPHNKDLLDQLSQISKCTPDLLFYSEETTQWVLNPNSNFSELFSIIEMFDIWVDIDANVCNTTHDSLPLKLNHDINPPVAPNKSQDCVYFGYTPNFLTLNTQDIINQIQIHHPFNHIKGIQILKNEKFIAIEQSQIWSCSEILCIKFHSTTHNYKFAIFNTLTLEVLFIFDSLDLYSPFIEKIISINYELLRINSFDLIDPLG